MDTAQLKQLIHALVSEQPNLIDIVDRQVMLRSNPLPPPQSAKSPRRRPVDITPFKRQVKYILRQGLRSLEDGFSLSFAALPQGWHAPQLPRVLQGKNVATPHSHSQSTPPPTRYATSIPVPLDHLTAPMPSSFSGARDHPIRACRAAPAPLDAPEAVALPLVDSR